MTSDSFVGAPSATTERDAALAALLRPPTLGELVLSYLNGALVVAEIEFRKLRHDPWELVTRAVQPVLWLVIFGQAFSRIRAIPTGGVSYLTFMTPGILAQSLMFVSIFYGLSIIWERDAGIVQKFLILPIPRASFVTGKGLGAGVRAVSQAIFIFLIALLLGVHLRWSVTGLLGSILAVIVGASFFSTLSMLIATIVKTRERFMGIGQVITMPLFFASNAIYPLSIMPDWLRVLSQINPLSYVVDLLRGYLVVGSVPNAVLDWAVLLAAVIIAQAIAAQRYHTIVI
ncbi:MAG: ABC transporter permease [Chloroflexi bacterium]|nr:ABC transporter permease [Chloroflexota bacterium]HLG51774.1 ABC transporter permease [Chloroflexota bacterium]